MLKKPSLLFFFSLFLILEPFLTIAFISIEQEFSFWHVMKRSFGLSAIEIFNFWVLFPLSGFLLLSIRSYTYLVFISLQIYNLVFHLNYESYTWPYLSDKPTPSSMILVGINVIIVIYLLLPDTRRPFFDRSVRWWERASRFQINEPCYLTIEGDIIKSTLVDISETGALIGLPENKLAPGSFLKMDFNLFNKDYEVNGNVVRKLNKMDGDNHLFGIQFSFDNIIQRYKMKFLKSSINKSNKYATYRK